MRAPVELVERAGGLAAAFEREIEAVALAPRVPADGQPELAREPHVEAACAQNERLV